MSKKTETIELRVSPELKSELRALSDERGRSVSDLVRELIGRELDGAADPQPVSGGSPMTHRPLRRAGRLALAALPILGLAMLYSLPGQRPAVASPEIRVTFAELDRNGDGAITEPEFAAAMAAAPLPPVPAACAGTWLEHEALRTPADIVRDEMAYLDANADGTITYDELEARLIAERADEFLQLDADGDGFVTLDEARVAMSDELARDDGLGVACSAALEAQEAAALGGEALPAEEAARLEIAAVDADRDGRVTLEEYLAR